MLGIVAIWQQPVDARTTVSRATGLKLQPIRVKFGHVHRAVSVEGRVRSGVCAKADTLSLPSGTVTLAIVRRGAANVVLRAGV